VTGAERIAAFAQGRWSLPGEVARAAALHFMDAIGVGLAASAGGEQRRWAGALSGPGRATCLDGGSAPPAEAAMLNGALIHSLEYDDTHIASVIHGSAVATPAALAAAEAEEADGKACLDAYALAWEVMIRIGLASPGGFQARGIQVTAAAGAVGAAAAAGRLMGLSRSELISAIGIAGSQASGLLAFLSDGSTVKALNPGWAAQTGLRAAALARAGMTGPPDILAGSFGLMAAFAGGSGGLDAALADLGETWRLPEAAFKLYPACHYIHPFLEALETLIGQGLTQDNLSSLTAHVATEEAPLIAEPWERRQAPRSGYDGKWGLAYCLALRLVDGSLDVASFEKAPRAAVIEVARRMAWAPVDDTGFPGVFPARLVARLTDGRDMQASVETVLGAPGRPIEVEWIRGKFQRNALRVMEAGLAETLGARLEALADQSDLSAVTGLLRR